ncbi:unnamed protein product [Darwinula stevensoni]|uniref:Signal peptide peptidase-like 2B n=1 Tax=Darwinula stevensoni TaxID=69355 RepID=A0A7R9FP89_9CRUS|nr:unnamed protein product [Darwinula stevensoni]CAG0897310.1 unnamed protein product [Darwinula stevensoni]
MKACGGELGHQLGVVCSQSRNVHMSHCMAFYPDMSKIRPDRGCSSHPENWSDFVDLSSYSGCDDWPAHNGNNSNKYIIFNYTGMCRVQEIAERVQTLGGTGLILMTTGMIPVISKNETFSIPVIAVTINTVDKWKDAPDPLAVYPYDPIIESSFDFSLLLIWILSVSTIAVGSYWSGHTRYELIEQRKGLQRVDGTGEEGRGGGSAQKSQDHHEEVSLNISVAVIILIVIAMCTMLLLLYFFHHYLVLVITILYCIASSTALYSCANCLLQKIPIGRCLCPFSPKCGQLEVQCQVRQVLLAGASVAAACIWFVYRKESWAWMLQDAMGIAFCLNLLRVLRLSSLKTLTILLCLLFFYDIFFVFITPYFTKVRSFPCLLVRISLAGVCIHKGHEIVSKQTGQSVMEEVVKGGSGDSGIDGAQGEYLPLVLKVPRFGENPLAPCMPSNDSDYSILGFGDVLVPGLLVAFCFGFDLQHKTPFHIYYVTGVIAYALGLIVTFIGLLLMASAQPALLYLVPANLTMTIIISLCRKEFHLMWKGDQDINEEESGGVKPEDTLETPIPYSIASSDDSTPQEIKDKDSLLKVDHWWGEVRKGSSSAMTKLRGANEVKLSDFLESRFLVNSCYAHSQVEFPLLDLVPYDPKSLVPIRRPIPNHDPCAAIGFKSFPRQPAEATHRNLQRTHIQSPLSNSHPRFMNSLFVG